MNRKLIAVICAAAMSAALCACSSSGNDSPSTTPAAESPAAADSADTAAEATEANQVSADDADDAGAGAGTADLTQQESVEGLVYSVDPAWTMQETTTEIPASDGSGNLTATIRTYISDNPADMNMLQVQAQPLDPALASLLDTLDDEALKTALGTMGTTTTTTSTEYGDVTTSMESMANPPAGARAAWTYTAEYTEGKPMKGAEIVTDTHIYMVNATGALSDIWEQIEATLSLS